MECTRTAKDRDSVVDIESGGSECEEEPRSEPVHANRRPKNLLRSIGGTLTFQGSDEGECGSNSYRNSLKGSDDEYSDIESLILSKFGGENEEHMTLIDKTQVKEKHKPSNSKKAPKPPRPRKGPSLDTADLKLVKEISELAMKKRARVERLKALKKMRAAKASSPSSSHGSSLCAMVITVIFFLVIIFQGFSSGHGSSLRFHDSPKPSTAAAANGLISVQFSNKVLEGNGIQQTSTPPNFVEQTSGSESRS